MYKSLHEPQWRETQGAAAKASIALMPFEFRSVDQLDASSPRGCEEPRRDLLLLE